MKRKVHPISVLRWTTVGFLILTCLCFFLPFVKLTPGAFLGILGSVSGKPTNPAPMSGFQMMLASLSDKPLHENLSVGALPSNALVILAFVNLLCAIAVLLIPRLRAHAFWISAWCSLTCSVSTVLSAVLFRAYYVRFTEGGDVLANLFEDGHLSVSAEAGLVVVAALSLLVFMSCFLLHFQLRDDPYFRSGSVIED